MLTSEIGLPVSLLADVFVRYDGEPMDIYQLRGKVDVLVDHLSKRGATIHAPNRHRRHLVINAPGMLRNRRVVI